MALKWPYVNVTFNVRLASDTRSKRPPPGDLLELMGLLSCLHNRERVWTKRLFALARSPDKFGDLVSVPSNSLCRNSSSFVCSLLRYLSASDMNAKWKGAYLFVASSYSTHRNLCQIVNTKWQKFQAVTFLW